MNTQQKIDDFIKLWLSVYKDDEQALRWYCKNILNNGEYILTIYENDICMAALSVPHMKFNYYGHEVTAAIMTNLVINPQYRHNNYELDILFYLGNYMYNEGVAVVGGNPVSKDLYILYQRRLHTIICESRSVKRAYRSEVSGCCTAKISVERTKRNIESQYNNLIKTLYRNYLVHPKEAFDYMAMEGEYFLAKDEQNNIRGIAMRFNYSDDYLVKELVADCDEARNALIETICDSYNWDYVDYESYDNSSNKGNGAIRVANILTMLNIYAKAHPEFKDSFNINDQNAIMNSGSYVIDNGTCRMVPDDDSLRTASMLEIHKLLFEEYNLNLGWIY